MTAHGNDGNERIGIGRALRGKWVRAIGSARAALAAGRLGRRPRLLAVVALVAVLGACVPGLLAPRSYLFNWTENKSFYGNNENSKFLAGSTTKLVTLYAGLYAIRIGLVSPTEYVRISERAQEQGCTCLVVDPNTNKSALKAGERFKFLDLLYAISISAGEATDAVAEHVGAQLAYGGVLATTKAESELRMRAFVDWANLLAVYHLGVQDTFLANVHGGDYCDFNYIDGCYDQQHNICPNTSSCGHGTTPADLTRIWRNAAALEPDFEKILGMTSWYIVSYNDEVYPPYYRYTPIGKWFGWYPGVYADKNGGSAQSKNSLVVAANRCGRRLISATMNSSQNSRTDAIALFDHGYSYFCSLKVKKKVVSTLSGLLGSSMSSSYSGKIMQAAIGSSGDLLLSAWHESDVEADPVMASIPVETTDGGGAQSDDGDVDVMLVGEQEAVTAVVEGGGVRMSSWMLTESADGEVVDISHANDSVLPGEFTRVRLFPIAPDVFVLVTADITGQIALRTIAHSMGDFALLTSTGPGEGPMGTSFALAGHPGGDPGAGTSGPMALMLVSEGGGDAEASHWEIAEDGSSITPMGNLMLAGQRDVSVAATSTPGSGSFAMASISAPAGTEGLQLHMLQLAADGSVELVRSVDASSTDPAASSTAIAGVEGGGPGSFVAGYRDGEVSGLWLVSFDVPDSGFELADVRMDSKPVAYGEGEVDLLASRSAPGFLAGVRSPASGPYNLEMWQLKGQ